MASGLLPVMMCTALMCAAGGRWSRGSGIESRQVDTAGNVVLNPVRIPPLLGIDLHAIQLHCKVNVISSGHARHAALAHHLPALHYVALMHIDVAQVTINGLQSIAVIDHDAI